MNYRIEADSSSWAIAKRRVTGPESKEPGTVTWTQFKWFATLEQAATTLLEMQTRENAGEATDAASIVEAAKSATETVVEAVKQSQTIAAGRVPDEGERR